MILFFKFLGKEHGLKAILSENLGAVSTPQTSYYAVAVVKKGSPLTINTLKVGQQDILLAIIVVSISIRIAIVIILARILFGRYDIDFL